MNKHLRRSTDWSSNCAEIIINSLKCYSYWLFLFWTYNEIHSSFHRQTKVNPMQTNIDIRCVMIVLINCFYHDRWQYLFSHYRKLSSGFAFIVSFWWWWVIRSKRAIWSMRWINNYFLIILIRSQNGTTRLTVFNNDHVSFIFSLSLARARSCSTNLIFIINPSHVSNTYLTIFFFLINTTSSGDADNRSWCSFVCRAIECLVFLLSWKQSMIIIN